MADPNNTAAPHAAGYIMQLERALHHLAEADAAASVAVEYIDDVAVLKDGKSKLQEQDKSSSKARELLGDRSKALWRTLQVWMTQRSEEHCATCDRYLFVCNQQVHAPIAAMLKRMATHEAEPLAVINALRSVGNKRSQSKIQKIIDDVLSHADEELSQLISRIEVVDNVGLAPDRAKLANRLAIDSRADIDAILDGLMGWLTRLLRTAWLQNQPGIVSREACVRQCRRLEAAQARRRFLPRPAREIPVSEPAKRSALARPFVEHLGRIEAQEEDVYQAIEHFIQFNAEKHRLASEGEIPDDEWRDRGDRLKQRWRNVMRQAVREAAPSADPREIGYRVLERSTYDHCEPLGGEPCAELYMTAGHYHRLADEDEVWWYPQFHPEAR